ncbi:outer membrane beta-barrel protein [Lacinutrix chionoecetis]
MNKKLVFLALFLTFSGLYAQETEVENSDFYLLRGEILVEGMLGYSSEDDERRAVKTSSFTINPKAGYLIADDLAIGLDLSYQEATEEPEEAEATEETTLAAGLFVRYYFLELGKRFKVYGEIGGGYLSTEFGIKENTQEATGFQAGIDIGINYFVKENIAISFVASDIANYQSLTYDEVMLSEELTIEEKTVSSLNADLNVFNNFFQSARFGVMFKF